MTCMKCGVEIPENQVFCDSCLSVMNRYPVKPDAHIHLPKRALNVEAAKMKLEEVLGFTKVSVEYKTSDKNKDTVISQSVVKDTELELDAEIKLVVSSGTKTVKETFELFEEGAGGEGEPTDYTAVIKNLKTGETVFSQTLSTSQKTVEVTVTGYGVMDFAFEADGIEMARYQIDFDKK